MEKNDTSICLINQIPKIQRSIYESVSSNKNNIKSIRFSKSFIKIVDNKKSPLGINISNVIKQVELSVKNKYGKG